MLIKNRMKDRNCFRAFGTRFIHNSCVETHFHPPCFRYTLLRAFDTQHRAFGTRFYVLLIHVFTCFHYTKRCKSFTINALQNPQYSIINSFILLLVVMWKVWKTQFYILTLNFLATGRKRKINTFLNLKYV
jgi:hypothetical protein